MKLTKKNSLLVGLSLSLSLLSAPVIAKTVSGTDHITHAAKAEQGDKKGQSAQHAVQTMREEWAHIKYQVTVKNEQLAAFEALIKKAEKWSLAYPNDAAVALWHGTILSTYASIKGGMGALPYVKEARSFLEKSISINSNIEMGLAHGVLGALYYRIPGWPIAFGDKEKAKKHLEMALQIGPHSMDNNYYYGDYLRDQGEYSQAKKFLITAQSIEPRKDKLAADKGRLKEVAEALKKVEEKLN